MNKRTYLLFISFLLEIVFLFFLNNKLEFIISPILLHGAGLFLAIFPYFILKGDNTLLLNENQVKYVFDKKIPLLLFIVLVIFTIIFANYTINANPLNITQSDIIPFIDKIFVTRFFNNEVVYAPYSGFNYGTFTPGYLPFHWGPYALGKYLCLNLQWVSVVFFLVSCIFYFIYLLKNIHHKKWLYINICLPFFLLFIIYLKKGSSAVQSIEVLIMGYYLFLSISIFSNNMFVKSIGVVMPLLSRYSFLFWLPIYFYNLLKVNTKKFIGVSLIVILLVVVLFVVPFVLPIPEMLKTLNANYITSTLAEWKGQSWQAPTDRPFQLFQGVGFASWFYQFGTGTLIQKIELVKLSLFIVSIITMAVMILFYKKIRLAVGSNLFSLLSLKLMLTLFYAFLIVPYDYLNWVPLMVSIVILSRINYSKQA